MPKLNDRERLVPEHEKPEKAPEGEYVDMLLAEEKANGKGSKPGPVNSSGSSGKGLGRTVTDKYNQGATAEQPETAGQVSPKP